MSYLAVTPARIGSGLGAHQTTLGARKMGQKLVIPPRLPDSRRMTRRTALRGAAWTAPAITIAVASPNFAAASGPTTPPPSITAVPGSATRSTSDRNQQLVTWSMTVTVGAAMPNLTVTFSGVSAVTGLTVTSAGGTWTGSGTSTRVLSSPLQAGDTLEISVVFERSSNGKDAGVSATFTTGSPSVNLGGCQAAIS